MWTSVTSGGNNSWIGGRDASHAPPTHKPVRQAMPSSSTTRRLTSPLCGPMSNHTHRIIVILLTTQWQAVAIHADCCSRFAPPERRTAAPDRRTRAARRCAHPPARPARLDGRLRRRPATGAADKRCTADADQSSFLITVLDWPVFAPILAPQRRENVRTTQRQRRVVYNGCAAIAHAELSTVRARRTNGSSLTSTPGRVPGRARRAACHRV